MMTKTDYEIVARELSRIKDKTNRLWITTRLSAEFTVRNDLFDRSKFLQVAQVWPCEFCDNLADDKADSVRHFKIFHSQAEQESK